MTFIKTGSCTRCGAPIWIPDPWANKEVPPPTTYSCLCHGIPGKVTLASEHGKDLTKRVEELEKEVEALKSGKVRTKQVLTD